jgi:hypothetical protein
MKKITLSIGLLAGILSSNAQDTTCTMVMKDVVHKFDYFADTILRSKEHTKGSVFINVGHNQVECLHLYDEVYRVRKVILTYDDGSQVTEICDSKSDVYYATGPVRIEVRRPRLFIAR